MPRMNPDEVAAFRAGFDACAESMLEVIQDVAAKCYAAALANAQPTTPPMTGRFSGEARFEVRLALVQGADTNVTRNKLRSLIEENPEALGLVQWPESEGHHPVQQVIPLPPIDT